VKVSETVTRLAVREITDEGVQGTVKVEAEKLTSVLRSELGNAAFNAIYAKMNDFYHKKRNLNRAKKKESFVLHPEIVRKRKKVTSTNESKAPFKKLKRPKIFNLKKTSFTRSITVILFSFISFNIFMYV